MQKQEAESLNGLPKAKAMAQVELRFSLVNVLAQSMLLAHTRLLLKEYYQHKFVLCSEQSLNSLPQGMVCYNGWLLKN